MATFTNQATLSYNGTVKTSNTVTGTLLESLNVTKTAVSAEYSLGDNITYVISLVNSEDTAYTGLTVTDNLGAYTYSTTTLVPLTYIDGSVLYYVNGTLQSTPSVTSSGTTLVISGISVPANGNATIIYEAQANSYAPLDTGGTITNTAAVSGSALAEDITASETVTAESQADLSISKAISPDTVATDGQITYTFVIQNSGNTAATADDAVIITDTFSPILSDITVTLNGTTLTEGTDYTYDTATGVFTTVSGVITVPAATYTRDETSGTVVINTGVTTLIVTGTI